MTQENLIEEINNDNPVILSIQAWGDKDDYTNVKKDGHYVTAIGYNPKGFIVEDPSISVRRGFISYDELDERWHDVGPDGKEYDHFGIVILCSKKFKPDKLKVVESYLNYLHERAWDEETENPDSFDTERFRNMLRDLDVRGVRAVRHALQPSIYKIYVRNFLGDYIGRPDTMNSMTIRNVGEEDFEDDIPIIKKRAKFAKMIKDRLPKYFIQQNPVTGETSDPGGEDGGEMGGGD